jgi:hypothetical protein
MGVATRNDRADPVPFGAVGSTSSGTWSIRRSRVVRSIWRTRSSWMTFANASEWNIPHLVLAAIPLTASLTRRS